MAQTTTHISACNAVVEVDNVAGAPTNISGSANTASIAFTRDIGEGTTFEGDFKLKTECKRDATLSLSVLWSTAVGEARDLMEEWFDLGGKRTIAIYPNGKIIGSRFYSGEFRLASADIPVDSNSADVIKMDFEAMSDGPVGFLNVGS